MYSLKDNLVGFNSITCSQNQSTILRDLKTVVNHSDSQISNNPSDYSLWYLGTFDTESGLIELTSMPEFVCDAISLKEDLNPSKRGKK
ncbi:nonstructural protein [Capybara microvirus Cap3_SP_469]|nr:nonstructural protein [Capybara microvirus Cap3_SP_469]